MALYTGVMGKISVKVGTGTSKDLAHMANFTVDLSRDVIEVLSLGSAAKEKVPSTKDWTASADGTADFDSTSGQKDLVDAYNAGTLLEASFYLATDTFLVGDCYVDSLSISNTADGKADISITLTGSGDVELTVPVGG